MAEMPETTSPVRRWATRPSNELTSEFRAGKRATPAPSGFTQKMPAENYTGHQNGRLKTDEFFPGRLLTKPGVG